MKCPTTHNKLRPETAVEAQKTFISENLSHAVHAVLVQQLTDNSAALVLHSRHQDNRL